MRQLPNIILEVANTHGGSISTINKLIEKYAKLEYPNYGIKFQIFKYSKISLPSYEWYDVYKKLYISKNDWTTIIKKAYKQIGQVWLDIFDIYGVQLLHKNKKYINGLKLQASVLYNNEVFAALKNEELDNLELIINISGYQITEIEEIINKFQKIQCKKIIIQTGFQSYPTSIEDTALNKIEILQKAFPDNEICFADHISIKETASRNFPVYAYLKGCTYIEKHICDKNSLCKYDGYSSIEYKELEQILSEITQVYKSNATPYISKAEKKYLMSTIQKPVLAQNIPNGTLIADSDLLYRRTNQNGLNILEIKSLQHNHYIINKKLNKYSTINKEDYRKAKIAVIVAGRMKSSRLKQKGILPIQGVPSIERCLSNCLKFENTDDVILATSNLKEDAILKDYTLKGKVKFWQGDPDDVITRYLGACKYYNIDIVIRVTADCPVVSPEIAAYLLESHFLTGADYTGANNSAPGTLCEIFNVEALKRVIKLMGKAEYSEYMTWYMRNNSHIFKLNLVDLPPEYVRPYRLTLDYQEDLDMFERLFKKLNKNHMEATLFNIFKILDENQDIAKINSHLTLRYKTDKKLIEKLNRVTKIRLKK